MRKKTVMMFPWLGHDGHISPFLELAKKLTDPIYPHPKHDNNVIHWLDTKAPRSTVFVYFGSESFISSDDLETTAYGLKMSNMNFIWVLWFPKDPKRKLKSSEALPYGFRERVRNRVRNRANLCSVGGGDWDWVGGGEGWDRAASMGESGRDCAISHGVEFWCDCVVRGNAKSLSACLRLKRDEEINIVVDELLQLRKRGVGRRVGGAQMFSGDGDFYRDHSKLVYAEENNVEEEVSIDERAKRFIQKFYETTQMFIKEGEEEEEDGEETLRNILDWQNLSLKRTRHKTNTPETSLDSLSGSN
nr:beta-D-glucosyl crocetin beta-1,6-glucosyltransferase-like [Tanacetum cinerariifolium]